MLVTVNERPDGVRVVKLTGKIDSITHRDFEEALRQVLRGRGVRAVFDFSGIDMVGSQGIGSLAQAASIAGNLGGKIAICSCNILVEQSLEVAKISEIIPICADVESAIVCLERKSNPVA